MKHLPNALVATFLGLCLTCGLAGRASAQEDVSQKTIPSLEMSEADVREALRALFKNVSVSYSIAPEVQGVVTVSLRSITFETALQNILRQVDATYRVEGGVYEIVRRSITVAPASVGQETATNVRTFIVRRIKIRSADPQFIAAMLGAKAGNQNYEISPELSTIARGSSTGGQGAGRNGGGSGGFGSGSSGAGGFGSGSSGSGSSGFGSGGSGGGLGRG